MILLIVAILITTTASAYVDVTYNYNVNNVEVVGYTCLDEGCNSVSSSPWSTSQTTSNGEITITYPSSLQQHGYAVYHYAEGQVPMAYHATWHSHGDPGHFDTSKSIDFYKLDECGSEIDTFDLTNDNYENEPVVIYMDASLDATTHSAFSETSNYVGYVPDEFKDKYYSADTRVSLTIKNGDNEVVYTETQDLTGAQSLYMDTEQQVEFTWTPTDFGEGYTATLATEVIDNQCSSSQPYDTSQNFNVWAARPQGDCYTLLNGLEASEPYPVKGDTVTFDYTKISNFADDDAPDITHTAVPTSVEYSIIRNSDNTEVYSDSAVLPANPDTVDPTTHSFTWETSDVETGSYTVEVKGLCDSNLCDGVENPEQTVDMQINVQEPPTYSLTWQLSDSYSGEPISNAQIELDSGEEANTDSEGEATISGLEPDNYYYTATHEDYQDITGGVELVDVDLTITRVMTPSEEPNNPPQISPGLPDVTMVKNTVHNSLDLDDYVVDSESADSDLTWSAEGNDKVGVEIGADHVVTFTPETDWTGQESITFTVEDPAGATNQDILSVTVTDNNTAPTLSGIPDFEMAENEHLFDAFYLPDYASDAETPSDELSYTIKNVTDSGCGVSIGTDLKVDIQPENNWNGLCQVTIEASDGELSGTDTFSINVTGTNNAPTITTSPVTQAYIGQQYIYDVAAEDLDGDNLTFALEQGPEGMPIDAETGYMSWTPNASDEGNHLVRINVTDGQSFDKQQYVLAVSEPPVNNSAPNITSTPITSAQVGQEYLYDVEATDADNDTLTYYLITYPTGMYINSESGEIHWNPSEEQEGNHLVTVRVTDGELSDNQEFEITVTGENQPPSFTSTPVTQAVVDMEYVYDVEAEDADNDTLTYSLLTFPAGMQIQNDTGVIQWTPDSGDLGNHSVAVEVTDGVETDQQEYTLTVLAEPISAPTITSTPVTQASINQLYSYDVEATHPENDTLTYTLTSYPSGMVIDDATGLIEWTPTPGDEGGHEVNVRVTDEAGMYDEQLFTITVNSGPVITSSPNLTAYDGQLWTYDVEATDADNDTLVYTLAESPEGMNINSGTGLVEWTPSNDQLGGNAVEVVVSDGITNASQSFVVNVFDTENAPVITSTPVTEFVLTPPDYDENYTYDVEAFDADGDALTYDLVEKPADEMTIDSATGLIVWETPDNNDVGTHTVTVNVSDGLYSTTQTYSLSVSMPEEQSQPQEVMHINRMSVDGMNGVYPGGTVELRTTFTNNGFYDIENADVRVMSQEYGLYTVSGSTTIETGETVTLRVELQLPEDISPGEHWARISIGDDGRRRVIHRPFLVRG